MAGRQRDSEEDEPRSSSAMWERLRSQGADLTALAEATASQFRDIRSDMAQQNAGVLASVERLANKIETGQQAINDRSRPQYLALFGGVLSAIATSVVIIQVLSGLHDKPVDDKLASLQTSISDLTKGVAASFGEVAKNTVSETEFKAAVDYRDKLTNMQNDMRNAIRSQMQKEIDTLDAEQKHTADMVVSRRELEFHWQGEDKRDAAIENTLAEISKRIDSLAPAGDVLKRLTENQHELELKVYGEHR